MPKKNRRTDFANGAGHKDEHSPPRKTHQTALPTAANAQGPAKRVYLIRHGESQGQRASRDRRSIDPNLIDCGITPQGEYQATIIPRLLGSERYGRIGCVVSSPLTRAVQTSLIGFPTKPVVIHYDLYEVGSRNKAGLPIPENRPRRLKDVLADTGGNDGVDGITFAPNPIGFPKSHEVLSNHERKQRVRIVWPQLWQFCVEQEHEEIAIVCHYNIIRMALPNRSSINPENAIPIECLLYRDGSIEVCSVLSAIVEDLSDVLAGTKVDAASGETQDYDDEGYMVFD